MVKRASGWFIQGQSWDADDKRPWRQRVHTRVLAAIQEGQLPAGSRLPSARQLAHEWGIARGTIDDAFAQLQADGLIERRVGQGSFVAQRVPRAAPLPPAPRREPNAATLRVLQRLQTITDDPADGPLHQQRGLRLRPQVGDISHFPLELWRRLVAQAYQEAQRERLSYGAAAGTAELRAATARHLALTRSLQCSPRQVLIVHSALHAFELISQVLLAPGDDVVVGDPNHVSTPRFFNLMHAQVHGAPVDHDGLDVHAAQRLVPRPAAVVVQPATHYPTGAQMSAERRQELLAWAGRCGAWIIEHEFLGEIAYTSHNPAPLLAQDRHECVLYTGSFNSSMFPSLRLSYLVVPERLCQAFAAVRGMLGDHCSVGLQLALAQFIDEGHLAVHVRMLRQLYRGRRDALWRALAASPVLGAGAVAVRSGLNICTTLPPGLADQALLPALAARGIAPLALSAHEWQQPRRNGLVLGFGADDETQIGEAVAHIAQLVEARLR